MNLSFAGCGFLGIYHVGVLSCFREYAPQILEYKVAGASAGALTATCALLGLPLGDSTSDLLKVAIKARSRALGPFHPGFEINKIIREACQSTFPPDAYKRVSGRLSISCTRVEDGENVLLTQFDSNEDLIQALLCSCFIPLWSGFAPPTFHGVAYMDGGFSNNIPVIDENTITVSPFAGESDICPQDISCSLLQVNFSNQSMAISPANLYRITRILFPAHPRILSQMCQQGFDDALKFLQRNNKINCGRCISVESSLRFHEKMLKAECDSGSNKVSFEDNEEESSSRPESSDSGCEDEDGIEHAPCPPCPPLARSASSCHVPYVGEEGEVCAACQDRRQMASIDTLPDQVLVAIQNACDQVDKGVINWIFKHRPVKILSILAAPYILPFDIGIILARKVWSRLPNIQERAYDSLARAIRLIESLSSNVNQTRHLYGAIFSLTYESELAAGSKEKEMIEEAEKANLGPRTCIGHLSSMLWTQS